jgi:hypothetical protein
MSALALAAQLEERGAVAEVYQGGEHRAAVWLDGSTWCTCGWRMDVPGALEVRALATRRGAHGVAGVDAGAG